MRETDTVARLLGNPRGAPSLPKRSIPPMRKIGVLMDPPERIRPAKDSTVAMLRAAARRGHEILVCGQSDLILAPGMVGLLSDWFAPIHIADAASLRSALLVLGVTLAAGVIASNAAFTPSWPSWVFIVLPPKTLIVRAMR